MSLTCVHGCLARTCEMCWALTEIARLRKALLLARGLISPHVCLGPDVCRRCSELWEVDTVLSEALQ